MYRTVTRNIEVVVTPRFVADRSSPENNYFFWAYTIAITNNGDDTVQLKTRHWRIIDATGRRQEVRGAGVVGEEPDDDRVPEERALQAPAGDRQIEGARVGLAHVIGLGSACGVHILERAAA